MKGLHRLASHPQDISLSTCKNLNSQKSNTSGSKYLVLLTMEQSVKHLCY